MRTKDFSRTTVASQILADLHIHRSISTTKARQEPLVSNENDRFLTLEQDATQENRRTYAFPARDGEIGSLVQGYAWQRPTDRRGE